MSSDNSANQYDLTVSGTEPKTIDFFTEDTRMIGLALKLTLSVSADDYRAVSDYSWTFTLLIEEGDL